MIGNFQILGIHPQCFGNASFNSKSFHNISKSPAHSYYFAIFLMLHANSGNFQLHWQYFANVCFTQSKFPKNWKFPLQWHYFLRFSLNAKYERNLWEFWTPSAILLALILKTFTIFRHFRSRSHYVTKFLNVAGNSENFGLIGNI